MSIRSLTLSLAAALSFCGEFSGGPARVAADEVVYYEENGVTYRETRRIVRKPVTETRVEPRERTVYRENVTTELVETDRTVLVPVTEYRWEAHWRGRYNPLVRPYLDQRLVPRTYLEPRVERVRTPVVRRELVPEVRVDQVPTVTRRFVEEEVVSRAIVSGRPITTSDPFAPSEQLARRERVGGTRLDNDPPRRVDDGGWRPGAARFH